MVFPVQEFLTILLGVCSWYIARRLKVPADTILGPMVVVGAASSLGLVHMDFPPLIKASLQIIVGTFLGYRISRETIGPIRTMVKPVLLVTAWMLSTAILIGYMLAAINHIDLATAFLGTSPGGIAEMSAMAVSIQADVTFVATLQSLRIISTIVAIPFLAKGIASPTYPQSQTSPMNSDRADNIFAELRRPQWIVCVAIGCLGALAASWMQIPAAAIVGSVVLVGLLRVSGWNLAQPPRWLRTIAQIGLGIVIGLTFTDQTLKELTSQFLPILVVTFATVSSALVLAGVVQRWLRTDMQTALLACAPGGVAQMGIIADELGAQVFIVNLFQLARLLSAVLILPLLIRLLI